MIILRKTIGLILIALQGTCTALSVYYVALTFDASRHVSQPGPVFSFKPNAMNTVALIFQIPLLVLCVIIGVGAAAVAGYTRLAWLFAIIALIATAISAILAAGG